MCTNVRLCSSQIAFMTFHSLHFVIILNYAAIDFWWDVLRNSLEGSSEVKITLMYIIRIQNFVIFNAHLMLMKIITITKILSLIFLQSVCAKITNSCFVVFEMVDFLQGKAMTFIDAYIVSQFKFCETLLKTLFGVQLSMRNNYSFASIILEFSQFFHRQSALGESDFLIWKHRKSC